MITAIRKTIVERTIIRVLIFSLWVLIAIFAKQNITISRSISEMRNFSRSSFSLSFLLFSFFRFSAAAHGDEFVSFLFFSTAIPPFRQYGFEKIYITWESPDLSHLIGLLRQTRGQMHQKPHQNQSVLCSQFAVCIAVCIFQCLRI